MDWYTAIGLPEDPNLNQSVPMGLESSLSAVSDGPAISSVSPSFWDQIKQDSVSAVNYAEQAVLHPIDTTKNLVSGVYGTAKSAVSTVYDDVAAPVQTAASSTYWYLIVAVVVVAGGLYFVGKGGLLGQVPR